MLTTGKGTHYCVFCGFDMRGKEERECIACDGDHCSAKKYVALSDLAPNHPRVLAAHKSPPPRKRLRVR